MQQAHIAFIVALSTSITASAQAPVAMRETVSPGMCFAVQARVEVAGELTLPPDKDQSKPAQMSVQGMSNLEYDERHLTSLPDRPGMRSIRTYRTAEFRRTVGPQTSSTTLRPVAKRMVVLHNTTREVPFSPDGPLTFGEFDMVRTDVYAAALSGLLSEKAVKPGDRWTAASAAVQELTDIEKITDGTLECRLDAIERHLARVRFGGKIRGVNEDGPTEQQLDGGFSFDLDRNCIVELSLTGTKLLLDGKGNPVGKIEGKFRLDRRPMNGTAELSDAVLKSLVLEPNSENTMLVYEGAGVGVRLLYPRRWRVTNEHGRQLTLDEPRGNGVLITIEPPAKMPTTEEYVRETREFLTKQKGTIVRIDPARTIRPAPREIEAFGMDVELEKQPARMEYYIARQQAGGAIVAARLAPADARVLGPEVEQIVKSVQIMASAPAGVVPLPKK